MLEFLTANWPSVIAGAAIPTVTLIFLIWQDHRRRSERRNDEDAHGEERGEDLRRSEEQRKMLEEQLKLSREAAAQSPKVALMQLRFADLSDSPKLQEQVRTIEDNIALRKEEGDPRSVYEGVLPDHFLEVTIKNVGRMAAFYVTGWIEVDSSIIEPIDLSSTDVLNLGNEIAVEHQDEERTVVRLEVPNREGKLLPIHRDWYSFHVPVKLHKLEDTAVDFEFSHSVEEPGGTRWQLRLASEQNN